MTNTTFNKIWTQTRGHQLFENNIGNVQDNYCIRIFEKALSIRFDCLKNQKFKPTIKIVDDVLTYRLDFFNKMKVLFLTGLKDDKLAYHPKHFNFYNSHSFNTVVIPFIDSHSNKYFYLLKNQSNIDFLKHNKETYLYEANIEDILNNTNWELITLCYNDDAIEIQCKNGEHYTKETKEAYTFFSNPDQKLITKYLPKKTRLYHVAYKGQKESHIVDIHDLIIHFGTQTNIKNLLRKINDKFNKTGQSIIEYKVKVDEDFYLFECNQDKVNACKKAKRGNSYYLHLIVSKDAFCYDLTEKAYKPTVQTVTFNKLQYIYNNNNSTSIEYNQVIKGDHLHGQETNLEQTKTVKRRKLDENIETSPETDNNLLDKQTILVDINNKNTKNVSQTCTSSLLEREIYIDDVTNIINKLYPECKGDFILWKIKRDEYLAKNNLKIVYAA